MGLDGLALCGNEEDFTLQEELNTEILTQERPWYEELKDNQLNYLFTERYTR